MRSPRASQPPYQPSLCQPNSALLSDDSPQVYYTPSNALEGVDGLYSSLPSLSFCNGRPVYKRKKVSMLRLYCSNASAQKSK